MSKSNTLDLASTFVVPQPDRFVRQGEHFHLYFEADDVDALAANLKGKGTALVREPEDTPWGTRGLALRDADGHTLYFGQPATTMRR